MTAPPFQTDPLLAPTPHGFYGRQGGVSEGIYDSLNVGLGSEDIPAHIITNRNRVAASLGAQNLITGYQTHSNTVAEVTSADDRPEADALFTKEKGIALGVLSADCVPVLMTGSSDGKKVDIIATAHAGWKGAVAGIIENLVMRLQHEQVHSISMKAVIGPSISQSAYQVGTDVYEKVTSIDPAAKSFFITETGRETFLFNLPLFVRSRLEAAGVTQISHLDICTYANPERYFSYRRTTHHKESDYGRQVSAITLA